jgi:5-oxoprolinase (ATP-hydrolysing) subunit A
MVPCDLNCDMGEGIGNDEAIMPFITSANIACGYHAGDEAIMTKTVDLCKQYKVHIGAHPSYPGRESFGRMAMDIPAEEVYDITKKQVELLQAIAAERQALVYHVKPHGALYNVAARNRQIAAAIARAVQDCGEQLILFGLCGSYLISEAEAIGLKTMREVFADRTYQEDGSLTPRTQPNALIEDENAAVNQVVQMVNEGTVTSVTGKKILIQADTICIHGDGKNAIAFARRLHEVLLKS